MSTAPSSKKRKVDSVSDTRHGREKIDDSSLIKVHVNSTRFRGPKLLSRCDSYQDFIAIVKKEFNVPLGTPIALFNNELPLCRGATVEDTNDAFELVIQIAHTLLWEQDVREDTPDCSEGSDYHGEHTQDDSGCEAYTCQRPRPIDIRTLAEEAAYRAVFAALQPGADEVVVKTLTGESIKLRVSLGDTVESVKMRILCTPGNGGTPVHDQRLIFAGKQLENDRKLSEYNITSGSTIHLILRLKGGKPVIHLFSPTEIEAKVCLSLDTAQWTSRVRYPEPAVSQSATHELLHWKVRTHLDGNLTVVLPAGKEVEVDSLFWEAETVDSPRFIESEGTSGIGGETFFPATPRIEPRDAILLPIEEVPLYLDRALKELTLHIGARTSFITYWLPSLLKHKFIALRFLPQAAYERAAPLDVEPKPDVFTRVFMLFQGVSPEEALKTQKWQQAVGKGTLDDVGLWRDVVGIDVEKAADKNLFRVLEWEGMEVK